MIENKLNIKYIKNKNYYIILDNKGRVIWSLDYCKNGSIGLYKFILQGTSINMTKQVKKYNFFLKNINIFGLYPLNNVNEFS